MTLELDDEELTDVREALRLHLLVLLKDLTKADRRRLIHLQTRLGRIEELYARLEGAAVAGPISATH